MRPSDVPFKCWHCRKQSTYPRSQRNAYKGRGKFCSRACHVAYNKAHPELHPNYKAARYVDSAGYVCVTKWDDGKSNWVREHRWLMEKHLGRKLDTSEHVHHINGNKLDNRLENLEILVASDHHKHHQQRYRAQFYDDISNLHAMGRSAASIASALGTTPTLVARVFDELGLPRRPVGRQPKGGPK